MYKNNNTLKHIYIHTHKPMFVHMYVYEYMHPYIKETHAYRQTHA